MTVGGEHEFQTVATACRSGRSGRHARLRRSELRSSAGSAVQGRRPARLRTLGPADEAHGGTACGRPCASCEGDLEPLRDAVDADASARLPEHDGHGSDGNCRRPRVVGKAPPDLSARHGPHPHRGVGLEAEHGGRPCGQLPAGLREPEGAERRGRDHDRAQGHQGQPLESRLRILDRGRRGALAGRLEAERRSGMGACRGQRGPEERRDPECQGAEGRTWLGQPSRCRPARPPARAEGLVRASAASRYRPTSRSCSTPPPRRRSRSA